MKYLSVFVALILFQGCASAYAPYTAGQVGCDEDDIDIQNVRHGFMNTTWVAMCNNRKFYCSMTKSGMMKQTSCRESVRR